MKRRLTIVLVSVGLIFTSALAFGAGGQTDIEALGMHLYKDKNLSGYQNQACQTCHHPLAGFADPDNLLDPEVNVVSVGSDGSSTGGRNAPSSAYAGYSPVLQEIGGEWYGGMFWDGRAAGWVLNDPLAEQAQGPPLNPGEMAMDSEKAVIEVIMAADYYPLWESVFGSIENLGDALEVAEAYDNFGRAIAAYERSKRVTRFSSKFDVARDQFSAVEERGEALFLNNCAACHATIADYGAPAPLFTTYGYANIGVPVNPLVLLDEADLGLGGFLDDWTQDGKFKIPTLRNIAMTAPYSHNGSFATLEEMVEFINDSSGIVPEVADNQSTSVGNLGLNHKDISDIIAFLKTLTDGY